NWVRAWQTNGIAGLLGSHGGGRPRALSEAMVLTAVQAASAESLTLVEIAQQVEAIHGELPGRIATLGGGASARGVHVQAQPVLAEKKRNEEDFAMKQATALQPRTQQDRDRLATSEISMATLRHLDERKHRCGASRSAGRLRRQISNSFRVNT